MKPRPSPSISAGSSWYLYVRNAVSANFRSFKKVQDSSPEDSTMHSPCNHAGLPTTEQHNEDLPGARPQARQEGRSLQSEQRDTQPFGRCKWTQQLPSRQEANQKSSTEGKTTPPHQHLEAPKSTYINQLPKRTREPRDATRINQAPWTSCDTQRPAGPRAPNFAPRTSLAQCRTAHEKPYFVGEIPIH